MKVACKKIDWEHGFTLVEVMVSLAILALASTIALSVVLAVQAGTHHVGKYGEQSQVLRAAVNQLADDLAYAVPDGDPSNLGKCCQGGGSSFSLFVYQPRALSTQWHSDWTAEGWPGWLSTARRLWVTYSIEDGSLIRTVHDPGDPNVVRVYARQVLASDLDPVRSAFQVDTSSNMISATLSTVETEGVPRAEVRSKWHIRRMRIRP